MIRGLVDNATLHDVADYLVQRHNVIASNLANIDNPKYARRELHFESELQREIENSNNMTKTHGKHISDDDQGEVNDATITTAPRYGNVPGLDSGNLEKDMSLMAKNVLRYNSIMTLISKDFTGKMDLLSKTI